MGTIDFEAARAVLLARRLERAVHDSGPWTMQYGGLVLPAVRMVLSDRVLFVSHLPEHCWLEVPEVLTLHCDGELVGSRSIEHPGDYAAELRWELVLPRVGVRT